MAPKAGAGKKEARTFAPGEKVPVPEAISFESNTFLDGLIGSGFDGSVIAAVGALKALAVGNSDNQIASVGAVQPIIELLKCGPPTTRDVAAEAIASLAENEPSNCSIIVKAGAIDPLVAHLSCESEVGQSASATSLKNLCIVPEHLELVRLAGAIPQVVALLRSTSNDVRSSCAGAVMAFSADAANRKEIIDSGAIEPLVELLQTPDLPGQGKNDAETALCRLVMDPAADKDLSRNSLVAPVLVDLVRSGGDNTKELACNALEDLSEFSESNREIIGNATAVETLVPQLKGAQLSLRVAAARALISLTRLQANRPRADAAGVIPLIAELLKSAELRDRSSGARLVEYVSRSIEAIQTKMVGTPGVTQALLELLQDPTQVSAVPSAKDAKKDTKKVDTKKVPVAQAVPIVEAEPEEPKAPNPDAEECHRASSMAICSLAATIRDHQVLFGTNGSVAALVALLSHPSAQVQAAAAKALTTIGQHESNQGPIVEQGAVAPLVRMMFSKVPKCMEKATECAWVLMERRHVENQDAFAEGGIIHPLSFLAIGKVPPPLEERVAEAEAGAVRPTEPAEGPHSDTEDVPSGAATPTKQWRKAFAQTSTLIKYDEEVTIETRTHAALAFRNMSAGNGPIRVQVGQFESPSPFAGLVDLLKCRGDPQEAAAGAIRDIAEDTEPNMVLAAKNDAIGNLVEMLITGRAAGKTLAADALRVLAGHVPNIRQIINGGAIEPMVEILRAYEDDKGRSSAAAALGFLGKSSKATRVLISVIGAIRPLIGLLAPGKEDEVRSSAAKALGSVALEHPPNQRDIADAKGLESLITMLGGLVRNPNEPLSLKLADATEDPKAGGKKPPPVKGGKEDVSTDGALASSAMCKEAAAEALYYILDRNQKLQRQAALLGVTKPLVKLLMPENTPQGRENAARAVAVLVQYFPNAAFFAILENGLPPLVDLLVSGTESGKEAAAFALNNLGLADERVRVMAVTAGCLMPLCELLRTAQTIGAQISAARALTVFCYDRANMSTTAQSGAVEPLVSMLASVRSEAKSVAARCICQVAALLGDVQQAFGKAGALPHLVKNLSSKDEDVRDSSALAMWTLLNHPQNKAEATQAGAIEPLVKVISKGAAKISKRERDGKRGEDSSASLGAAAFNEVQDAVNELVDLLRRGTDGGKKDAAWGLVNISYTPESQYCVMRAGAVPLLVNLLVYGSDRASQAAMWALWRLAANQDIRPRIAEPNVVNIVVENVLRRGAPLGRIAAACCLGDLCGPESLQTTKIVYKAGTVPILLELLLGFDPNPEERARRKSNGVPEERDVKPSRVKDASAWALLRMLQALRAGSAASDVDLQQNLSDYIHEVARDDICAELIQTLKNGSRQGRQAAAALLNNLATERPNLIGQLVQQGALEALLGVIPGLIPPPPPPPEPVRPVTPPAQPAPPPPPAPAPPAAGAKGGKAPAPPPPEPPKEEAPAPPPGPTFLIPEFEAVLNPAAAEVLRDCALFLGLLVHNHPTHARRAVDLNLIEALRESVAGIPLSVRSTTVTGIRVLSSVLWSIWCTLGSCPKPWGIDLEAMGKLSLGIIQRKSYNRTVLSRDNDAMQALRHAAGILMVLAGAGPEAQTALAHLDAIPITLHALEVADRARVRGAAGRRVAKDAALFVTEALRFLAVLCHNHAANQKLAVQCGITRRLISLTACLDDGIVQAVSSLIRVMSQLPNFKHEVAENKDVVRNLLLQLDFGVSVAIAVDSSDFSAVDVARMEASEPAHLSSSSRLPLPTPPASLSDLPGYLGSSATSTVRPLFALVPTNPVVAQGASAALAALCQNHAELQTSLMRFGALQICRNLLKSDEITSNVKCAVMGIVVSMASRETTVQKAVAASGVIEAVIPLLSAHEPDEVRRTAAWSLLKLVALRGSAEIIQEGVHSLGLAGEGEPSAVMGLLQNLVAAAS